MKRCPSVGIIGAGAAGLVATEVLSCSGVHVRTFERSKALGGVWNLAINKEGPMYKTLRSNLPKEIMAVPGFDFIDEIEHFKSTSENLSALLKDYSTSQSSFVTHAEVQLYLERYAMEHDLGQFVQFGANVRHVVKRGDQWEITYSEMDGTEMKSERYDHVVVANGHYNEPYLPHVDGIERYTGKVQHSLEYDGPLPELYGDQTVLVVGGRSSGTDLAREISQVAGKVYCSDRNMQRIPGLTCHHDNNKCGKDGGADGGFGPRHNLYYRPGLQEVSPDGSKIVFTDGTDAEVDVIIWCTGFLYDFPFLSTSTLDTSKLPDDIDKARREALLFSRRDRVKSPIGASHGVGDGGSLLECNGRRLKGLYEQCFCARDPTLSFIGIPYAIVPFPMFYVQARWIAAVIKGTDTLPGPAEIEAWLARYQADVTAAGMDSDSKYHYLGARQWEYNRRIAERGCRGTSSRSGPPELKQLLLSLNTSERIYNENSERRPLAIGLHDAYRGYKYEISSEKDDDGVGYFPYEAVSVGKGA